MPLPLATEALFDYALVYTASIFLVAPLSEIVGDRKGENAVRVTYELVETYVDALFGLEKNTLCSALKASGTAI
jgi:hypothetical protein